MSEIISINPASGEVLKRFAPHSKAEVERRLNVAVAAGQSYRRMPILDRARLLLKLAESLESEKHIHARTMTLEMGKLLKAALQEIEKCALACRYYAQHGPGFLADEAVPTDAASSFVRCEPVGPVLAVMPWNFPFWQLFRFAAPGLLAGNTVLLKHASNVPECALAIEELVRRAGFPEGVFQTLLVGSDRVGPLIQDQRIKAVTLTGSVAAGQSVAAAAGAQVKKTVLELGGSDPFIVMPSANIDQAVATAVQARTINNGQSCIAAKRFILHRHIAEEFQRKFVERMASLKMGDPMAETTDLGPLATAELCQSLQDQVNRSVQMGARLLLGGQRLAGPGNYFPPTILADPPESSPASREEMFGPVASLFTVEDIEEAVRLANSTSFGLGSSAWTANEAERAFFISELEAGMVFINSMVASDPRLPFGGIKQSGYGRELSREGLREFVNLKTVLVPRASKHAETE